MAYSVHKSQNAQALEQDLPLRSTSAGLRRSSTKNSQRIHKPVQLRRSASPSWSLKSVLSKGSQQSLRGITASGENAAGTGINMSHEKSGRHASEASFQQLIQERYSTDKATTHQTSFSSTGLPQPTLPLSRTQQGAQERFLSTPTGRGLYPDHSIQLKHALASDTDAGFDTDSEGNSTLSDNESIFSDTCSVGTDTTDLDFYMSPSAFSESDSMDADEDALDAAEKATLDRIEAALAGAHQVQELTRPWVEMGVVLAAAAQNPRAREMTVAQLYEQLGKVGTSKALEIMAQPVTEMDTTQRAGCGQENGSPNGTTKANTAMMLMDGNLPASTLSCGDVSLNGEPHGCGAGNDGHKTQLG